MGFIAVVIIALVVLSAGESQLLLWEFVRFVAVGVPLNFALHLFGGWLLGKIILARYGEPVFDVLGEVSPEIVARTASDPIFNAAKFLIWAGKWVAVIAVGLAVAR